MLTAADLPDDIAALKAMLLASERRVQERDDQVAGLEAQLKTRAAEIEHLKLWIAKLRRMQFGRKSEKMDHQIEQLELQLEDLQADEGEVAKALPETDRAPRNKPVRKPLPEHLPRDEKVHLPAAYACPSCGGGLRFLGEDVAEQLEYVPASFRVIRHMRPKLACGCCDTIVQAPAPSRPIERGIAGPGALAHVLVAKFADHLPLYRQSVIYAREGVDLDRALLASWVGAASALLRPLVDAIRRHVLAATKLHADDTPIQVLAPGNGKTKTARLWTYVRDDRPSGDTAPAAVWFAIRRIAKAFIHKPIWLVSVACCKPMHMPASTRFTKTAGSRRPDAGPMLGANSMTCTKRGHRRSRRKRYAGSPSSTSSRPISEASRPIIGGRPGKPGPAPCSTTLNAGYAPRLRSCRASPIHRQPSCTRSICGRH
jgi:transposase